MVLPLSAAESRHRCGSRAWINVLHPRRHTKLYRIAILLSSSLWLLWFSGFLESPIAFLEHHFTLNLKTNNLPPLYEQWCTLRFPSFTHHLIPDLDRAEFERHLPQQDESLSYPEGANADFFYAANHVWGLGFNNALQEQLFLSHLAYIANKTFVFDEYTWNYDLSQPYTDYQGKLIPSRIPYTAFISGPTVGGSFGKDDKAPRAVTKSYYQKLCPKPLTMKSNDVNDKLDPYADASVMMKAWARKLRQTRAKCIEVGPSDQIFSYMVFGDGRRVQPFFDEFINSPILKRFAWSSLVNDAVSTNIHLFSDASKPQDRPLSPARLLQDDDDIEDATNPIPGLLAIHVRRGDFLDHCRNLASWEAKYMGWLQIPLLVDRFKKPLRTGSENNEAIMNHYLKHCWPTIEEIVQKIDEVRQTPEGRGLKRVYIMTNGPTDWVEDLKNKIMDMGGWKGVASSRDLTLVPEQKYIAQAVDMAIAMRSQMYIGNGFSSLSANVVILRLGRKFPALANRLW